MQTRICWIYRSRARWDRLFTGLLQGFDAGLNGRWNDGKMANNEKVRVELACPVRADHRTVQTVEVASCGESEISCDWCGVVSRLALNLPAELVDGETEVRQAMVWCGKLERMVQQTIRARQVSRL